MTKTLPLLSKTLQKRSFLFFVCLILPFFASNCTVRLAGNYDEISDNTLSVVEEQTLSFFNKLKTASPGDGEYEVNKSFYEDIYGKISMLIMYWEKSIKKRRFLPKMNQKSSCRTWLRLAYGKSRER
jgi:hypothetical protein